MDYVSCSNASACTDNGVGSLCQAGKCRCQSDSECTNGNVGDACVDGRCAIPTSEGTYATPKADFESVMASTYFNNTVNANKDGNANPIDSLSAWDVLGIQKIYGSKADGSVVGLGGRCLHTAANGVLKYSDCTADGSDIFPVSWDHYPTSPVPLEAYAYHRFRNNYGANQCWTASGNSVSGSTCLSPLPASQQFYMPAVRWRAMGNMCVVATAAVAGTTSTLKLQRCGDGPKEVARWDWIGNQLRLSGTNLCVTAPSSPVAGSRPYLAMCLFAQAQPPSLQFLQNFVFSGTKIAFGNLSFNVLGGVASVGANIGLYNTTGDNTKFYLTGQIRAMSNDKCLDLPGSQTNNNTTVSLYTCGANGQPNQEWDYHF